MHNYYVGQIILDKGIYKTVRAIGKDWIETAYLKPNSKGWRKIEKKYFKQNKPIWLKIDQYKNIDGIETIVL
jgi:hypothetical protein